MEISGLARVESLLQTQQKVLSDLIEALLVSLRESTDSSIGSVHLITKLHALAQTLEGSPSAGAKPVPKNQ